MKTGPAALAMPATAPTIENGWNSLVQIRQDFAHVPFLLRVSENFVSSPAVHTPPIEPRDSIRRVRAPVRAAAIWKKFRRLIEFLSGLQ